MYNYIRNKINSVQLPFEVDEEVRKLATPSAVAGGGLLASYLANGLLPGSDVDPATIALGAGAAFGTPSGSLYSKVGKLALGGEIAKTALNAALGTDYQTPGIVPVGLLAGGLANRYGRRWFDPNNIDKGDIPTPQQPNPVSPTSPTSPSPNAWDMEVTINAPNNPAPPIVSPNPLGGSKVVNSNPSAVVQNVIDTKSTASSPLGMHYGLTPEQERNLMANIGNARLLDPAKLDAVINPEKTARDGSTLVKFLSQPMNPQLSASLVFPSQLTGKGMQFEGKELYNPDNMVIHKDYPVSDRVHNSKVVAIGNLSPLVKDKSYLVQQGQMEDGGLFPTVWGLQDNEVVSGNIPIGVNKNMEQLTKIGNKIMDTPRYKVNSYLQEVGGGSQTQAFALDEFLGLRQSKKRRAGEYYGVYDKTAI